MPRKTLHGTTASPPERVMRGAVNSSEMNHPDCRPWEAATLLSSGLDQAHERGLKAAARAGSNYFRRRIRPSTQVPRPRSPTEVGSGTVRNPRISPPPLFAVWILMYHLPARSSASFVSALPPKTVSRSTSGFVKTPPVTALLDRVRLTRTPAVCVKPFPLALAVDPWMWELLARLLRSVKPWELPQPTLVRSRRLVTSS